MYELTSDIVKKFKSPQFNKSCILSFEGIEGCGKTTQIELLKNRINNYGLNCTVVREPGGTQFGEKLRSAILDNKQSISPLAEAHLFAASRSQLLDEVVLPLLERPNNVVIYDRFTHSSIAYQGYGGDLGPIKILEIHQHYPLNILPLQTYYLDISVETSFKRQMIRNNQADYFESKSVSFYHKIKNGYDSLAQIFDQNVIKIDSEQSIEIISESIWGNTIKILDNLR